MRAGSRLRQNLDRQTIPEIFLATPGIAGQGTGVRASEILFPTKARGLG